MRLFLGLLLSLVMCTNYAQDETSYRFFSKEITTKELVKLDSVSISSYQFQLKYLDGETVSDELYQVDFPKAELRLKPSLIQQASKLYVYYARYPKLFYLNTTAVDSSYILPNSANTNTKLVDLQLQTPKAKLKNPFSGLQTSGNLSRSLIVGNNQNAVVQSELDLQISGELANDLRINASIRDANLPSQAGGYTQNLNEFDQIFIELEAKNWAIRAGDIDLYSESRFAAYTKRVQGLRIKANFDDEGSNAAFAAAALVRGVFKRSEIQAQEGNQGPYKLVGTNGEQYILIVSGSESVFVNGTKLKRGENADYIIDYNAGEVIFNANYPIDSRMRIIVEYQVAEQNYSRVIATTGGQLETNQLRLAASVYHESDLKNQPLQQSLTETQVDFLQLAGDDQSLMFAPSATPAEYNENRILYRQENVNGEIIYVFSNNPEDELFNVRFTNVGENQGNYVVSDQEAITTIFEYVAPVNGIPQGSYEPIVRLIAPTQLQIGNISGSYQTFKHQDIKFELSASRNDENLYSTLDDDNNEGIAAHVELNQSLLTADSLNPHDLKLTGQIDFIDQNYQSIERLYNVEFNRDWNIETPLNANQNYYRIGSAYNFNAQLKARYAFEKLQFGEFYDGQKHIFSTQSQFKKLQFNARGSYLETESQSLETEFFRLFSSAEYSLNKTWVGTSFDTERNELLDVETQEYSNLSQGFAAYSAYVGVGDSTKVYSKLSYTFRENDSLRQNKLQRVNSSHNFSLESTLIKQKNTNLSLFGRWRKLQFNQQNIPDETSVNGRLRYTQSLFNSALNLTTAYETNSGNIARQAFTYVEVEPGQGQYTWIDYNANEIQELNEFEVAQFQDQARYIRVLLPNQNFVRTNRNRFSQQVQVDFKRFANTERPLKFLSHFYNQTSLIIDQQVERDGSGIKLNPFTSSGEQLIGQNNVIRNSLFFNRGLRKYSTTYNFNLSESKNLLIVGLQSQLNRLHELQFQHEIKELWLFTLNQKLTQSEQASANFENRNFKIDGFQVSPKFSYLPAGNKQFDVFYSFKNAETSLGEFALLEQHELGLSFNVNNQQKYSLRGELKYIKNAFEGNANSPVAFQLLEGLQPDDNFTWSLFLQKRLSNFLDVNITYLGRKTPQNATIHTGNIQLRAFF
ncbi:hypothetical protein SAMN05444278_103178 [Psychroflexus salarius]|uniref:Uncharacterized protein n=1 Tax=Psychroflexus salarius TaxID=1155689 RepID=A0A1M4V006_9FLAO|nr:hypothetical protein [Psychroflexus salarius]SHE62240.1 hypothetical protein SAMN05444278_103178 [Psychroflexus salarius]